MEKELKELENRYFMLQMKDHWEQGDYKLADEFYSEIQKLKAKQLNEDNYFSKENQIKYTGSSQIKDFLECEACALAKLNGEWEEEKSKAMLVSSYIDAAVSGPREFSQFVEKNPDIFTKQGELKADYKLAEEVFHQIENDEMFWKYLNGEHQVIMTGEISGVPIKIKIDSLHKDKCIVDLKAIANFDLIWNEETHQKENFIDYYDYITQAALYQEITRQNTGKQLPFIIAAATKQKYSERALLQIPQEVMNLKLDFLQQYLPHLQDVKQGKVKPTSCGHCNYCISKKKCDGIYYYDSFFNKETTYKI